MFVWHGRRRRAKFVPMTTLYARAFVTEDDHIKDSFLWYTDGIPFLIDDSATATIFSQSRLFTGLLVPRSVTLETAEGLTTTTKLVGGTKLIQNGKANKHHSYDVPRCVFDPRPLYIF